MYLILTIYLFLIFSHNTLYILIISYTNDHPSIQININEVIRIHEIRGKVTRGENGTVPTHTCTSHSFINSDGKKFGYHASTFALYLDQIVRRVDPKGRSLAQYFHEEMAQPFSE